MKKIILSLCVLVCAFAVMPRTAQAADVSVGATMWVSEWDPSFKKAMESSGVSVKMDPGLVAGPVFSVRFADAFSWSNVLLFGRYTGKADVPAYGTSMKLETWRSDLDSTLNYSFNKYFKVFGGLKAMYMSYAFQQSGYASNTVWSVSAGPAAGIGLSLPLTDSLFALCNVSGIYMRGVSHASGTTTEIYANIFGINSTVSLAYYVAGWSTTFSVGGRYQQLRYYSDSSSSSDNGSADKFYGLVLSAIYTF